MDVHPTTFAVSREAELIHARWAMWGTLGCFIIELLAKYASVQFGENAWFKAGAPIFSKGGWDNLGSCKLVRTRPSLPSWPTKIV